MSRVFFLLGIAIFSVYYNALDNDFVFDDYFVVLDHGAVRLSPKNWLRFFGLGWVGQYRPLRTFSYAIDYQLGGLNPFVYHLSNIIYHWLAAYVAFLIVLRLTGESPPNTQHKIQDLGSKPYGRSLGMAFCATLLWALHPIQTDSVTYISGRRDILAGLFFFLGFYAFLRLRALDSKLWTPGRVIWLGVTFSAFVLGLLSKEVALVLPLVFFTYDFCRSYSPGRKLWRQVGGCFGQGKLFYLPFFATALFALGYYLTYVAPLLKWHGGSPLTTFATVPHIWLHYLKLLFLPLTLNADYSGAFSLSKSFFESRALLATLSLTLLVAAILWGLRRGQWLPAFCGFWFIITLLPVSQIFPHPEMVAEHYLYLPSFGFCLLLALMGGCLARRSKGIGYGLMAGLLIFYGVRTVVRNQDWQDEATFWQKTVVTAPTSARAHHNLAVVLKEKGDLQGALLEFQRAAEVNPNYGYSYIGIAEIYFHWTLFKEALIVAQKGVQLQPQWPQAHFILALVYARLGESSKAIPALKQALALRPDYLLASQLLSELCRKRAEPEKACE